MSKEVKKEEKDSVISPAFERKPARQEIKNTAESCISEKICVALNQPGGQNFPMLDGRVVHLNGTGYELVGAKKGMIPVGAPAYAMTFIAKSDWEEILKRYGKMKLFTEGFCFAANRKPDVEKEAENRDDLRNGFEPVDAEKDPDLKGLDGNKNNKKKK